VQGLYTPRLRPCRRALGYLDDLAQQWVADSIIRAGGFLLGRRTYEIFVAHWPYASEEEQVLAEPLNTKPKYVASRTLAEPLAWENSTQLQGDVADAVACIEAACRTSAAHTRELRLRIQL
jgi:dihydrofolate reductase